MGLAPLGFGPLRGGLAIAVIRVGALLAATTGIVAAAVISMGLISLPIMLRYGYNRTVATGTITASGTLAQALPPSLVLIVLADQLGRSVGDMYAGALYPGLLLVAAPTEGGALGAMGALVMAGARGRVNLKLLAMVWFGGVIAMNMQTSFLAPPFGFAPFWLRSVAAKADYKDCIAIQTIPAVTTGQIHEGSITFILLQLMMVAAVIAFPTLVVGRLLDTGPKVDVD
jgi:TRAP-type mannitol/chloroaromatic compound transport system permease large subunit